MTVGLLSFLFGGPATVSPAEAHEKMQAGAMLLDVRRKREWKQVHVPGAKHVPLHTLDKRLAHLDPDQPVLCLCASGRRSAKAARQLDAAGFEAVHSVKGGIQAWQRAGLPVEG